MSIHWPIIKACLRQPGRVAVVDDKGTHKSAHILVAAMHMAAVIRSRCESKTVGILLPTSGAFPMAALGAWSVGKTIVPLNYLLKREELEYVVGDCETDTIVTAKAMLEFMGYTPPCKNLILMDEIDFRSMPEPVLPAGAEDEDVAILLYTSGTSGKPKGVILTHRNITSNIRQIFEFVEFTQKDVMLGVLPQFHSFGLNALTMLPLAGGLKVVYSARFVPQKIVKLIREHRPTVMIAIPSMYNALLAVKDATADDFKSMRYVVSGGEPLPDAVFAKFRERFGITINEGYGLTETSPVTNWCRPHEWRAHSVGKPLPELEERIADPNSPPDAVRSLPPGHDGEVQMRGPNVTQGYYKLPDETAKLFTPDGWMKTGDMGRLDDDGFLYITGRIKEMLIIGGENVFPREIEEVLNKHESVADSGVVGVQDPMRGELPVAFVELKEGATFDETALLMWCRKSLAGYKVPKEIRVLQPLPRNATGKIMRRELKKLV
jgi:long-chain acyl-CoA synthetase